jgi:Anti-sigma factor NepR
MFDFGSVGRDAVAPLIEICMTRLSTRARGDERLSAKKRGQSDEAGRSRGSKKPAASIPKARKHRPGDLGRALRSVYDDTLRETIPEDFISLIGKLT